MSLCPLTADKLLNLEAKLCKSLVTVLNMFPGEKFALLQGQAHKLHEFVRKPKENPLELVVCFEGRDPRGKDLWWIHLGAKLEQPGSDHTATYFMAIGKKGDEPGRVSETLSKVHWDYAFGATTNNEKKPNRHLQFAGTIHDQLSEFGYSSVWTGMDKPRIPSLPICFVTLMHWAFLEFGHCEHIKKIVNETWWISLVRKAEEETIRGFVDTASEFFRTQQTESFLTKGYH